MADDVSTWTPVEQIGSRVDGVREAFDSGRTRPLEWRLEIIARLRDLVVARTDDVVEAVRSDLGKCAAETMTTELGVVMAEAEHTLAHLPDWVRPTKVRATAAAQPGRSRIEYQPLGVAAVIAPWNYPVNLSLGPLIHALAAGNAVVLKPSEQAPASSALIADIVDGLADPALAVVTGGVAETTELLEQRFDYILYTGGGRVGRIVMRAAAEHLTPVTLELGGKSPALVSRQADIDLAARRLVWGKFVNAGQTCIAPDYVMVERPVHDRLVEAMAAEIEGFYGPDPQQSPDFARIVTSSHFHRLEKLLDSGTVAAGGETDVDDRYIAPTILTGVGLEDPVMEEEIFGPVLPVLAVDSLGEAVDVVNDRDRPLALYLFTDDDDEVTEVLGATSSGGVTVNATLIHAASPNLPFGGVGESGMGAYRGRFGFETFSHRRAVHEQSTRFDLPLLYPPYTEGKTRWLRRALKLGDPVDGLAKVKQRLLRRR